MSLIRSISIALSLDSRPFATSARTAAADLDEITAAAGRTQKAVDGIDLAKLRAGTGGGGLAAPAGPAAASTTAGPAGGGGSDLAAIGDVVGHIESAAIMASGRIQQALMAAVGPIGDVVNRLGIRFRTVGGTMVEFAKRGDYAMQRFIQDINVLVQLVDQLRIGFKAVHPDQVKLGPITPTAKTFGTGDLKLFQTTARGAFQNLGLTKILSDFGFFRRELGSVEKSMRSLGGVRLDAAAGGAMKLSSSIKTIGPAASTAATGIKRVGLEIAAALGFVALIYKGTQAVVSFFTASTRGAIAMEGELHKSQVVFEGFTAAVEENANRMAAAYGVPKKAILEGSDSIGYLLQGVNMSTGASANLSIALSQVAADVANLNQSSLEEAFQKIQAGVGGASKGLKEYGVSLTESAVKAEGLRLGLVSGKQEMDDTAKYSARASLILQGFDKASGDLAKTQDTVGTQLAKMKGNAANFAAAFGAQLLPAISAGIGALNSLADAVRSSFTGTNGAYIATWAAKAVAAFDTVAVVFRNLPLVGELAFLTISQSLQNLTAVFATIPANLKLIGDYISGNWLAIIKDAIRYAWELFANLGQRITELGDAINTFLTGGGFKPNFKPLITEFEATAAALPAIVKPAWVTMGKDIEAVQAKIRAAEAARAVPILPAEVPKPALQFEGGPEAKDKGEKYHGTAAAELGSKEAASAFARFQNKSIEDASGKATAKNTAATAKATMTMAQALAEIAHRGGPDTLLSSYTF